MWSNYGEIKEIKFEVKGGFPFLFKFAVTKNSIARMQMS